jgi:hypothetical protein
MPPNSGDDDQPRQVGSTVAEETTRIEAVEYLQGVSGHGVFSLVFVAVTALFVYRDEFGMAVLAAIVAFGIALNGLSIYLWDELRVYFEPLFEADAETTRSLSPRRASAELKAELAAGSVLISGVTAIIGLVVWLFRTVGPRRTVLVTMSGLAFGTLCALGWTYTRS